MEENIVPRTVVTRIHNHSVTRIIISTHARNNHGIFLKISTQYSKMAERMRSKQRATEHERHMNTRFKTMESHSIKLLKLRSALMGLAKICICFSEAKELAKANQNQP